MRKKALFTDDPKVQAELFNETIGRVGIITPHGYPRIVPVNFVVIRGMIYFHGAREGEKYQAFISQSKVSFQIEKCYSSIPSYWLGKKSACTATIFYKSLSLRGKGSMVDDNNEKADALNGMMEKDQPEGGYLPITADEPHYRTALEETGIYRIEPIEMTIKCNFGQTRTEKVRKTIIGKLRERGEKLDLETALEVERIVGGD